MSRRPLLTSLMAAVTALPLAASAAGFNSADEGWTTPDGIQTWQATGGNVGGWLQVEDLDGSTDILLTAPSGWLGNWSSFLGGTLSFDVKKVNDASSDWPGFGEIRITGAGGSVVLDIIAPNLPADNLWTHYSVALTPAAGWSGDSLAAVLNNVTSLTINGEFHTGPGEIVGFDNIQVTAVPEPASALLLLGGLGLLAGLRRKR